MSSKGKILVTGAAGMVGSAVCRTLAVSGIPFITSTREQVNLTDRSAVDAFFDQQSAEWVVIAAAKVGGIQANDVYPAEFIYENLMIEANLIDSAYRHGINKLLFLGSSCIYPRDAEQPIREPALLTGPLELTNEPYAIAKIAGIKLCESYNRQYGTDFRCLMPTNLYGPHDSFHPEDAHVIPALMRRFHEAKQARASEVSVWGSGRPRREFLHVDDLASAALHVMSIPAADFWSDRDQRCSHLNVGAGADISIVELVEILKEVIGLQADVCFDASKPDGTPRKLLDVTALKHLGWEPAIELKAGLRSTYQWFLEAEEDLRS